MLSWGRQRVPICGDCNAKLAKATPPVPYCAFYDVDPTDLLPQEEARGPDARGQTPAGGRSSSSTATPVPPRPHPPGRHQPVPVPAAPGQTAYGTAERPGLSRLARPTPRQGRRCDECRLGNGALRQHPRRGRRHTPDQGLRRRRTLTTDQPRLDRQTGHQARRKPGLSIERGLTCQSCPAGASLILPLLAPAPGAGKTGSDAVVIEKPGKRVGQWA